MRSVHGIFDGKTVTITDKITEKRKYRVIVTFIEELPQNKNELRDFSAQTKGLEFWEDSKEDIYQDFMVQKS
jgi:hypothetical protein